MVRHSFTTKLVLSIAMALLAAGVLMIGAASTVHAADITVTTTVDEFGPAGETGAGCSLREAIQASNTNASFGGCTGSGTILLPAGTYTLSITGRFEDNNATGDLDITRQVQIIGDGAGVTIIDGGGIDRVFDILFPSDVRIALFFGEMVSFVDVTIQNGSIPAQSISAVELTGGGIRLIHGGAVFKWSAIINNFAAVAGGGILLDRRSDVFLLDTTISGNQASIGAGILSSFFPEPFFVEQKSTSLLVLLLSTVSGNISAGIAAGGLWIGPGSDVTIINTTISGNEVATPGPDDDRVSVGGGLFNLDGFVEFTNSTITGNTAEDGAGVYTQFGDVFFQNSIIANNNLGTNCGLKV